MLTGSNEKAAKEGYHTTKEVVTCHQLWITDFRVPIEGIERRMLTCLIGWKLVNEPVVFTFFTPERKIMKINK